MHKKIVKYINFIDIDHMFGTWIHSQELCIEQKPLAL